MPAQPGQQGTAAGKPEQRATAPGVSGFRIRADRKCDLAELFNKLSVLNFMEFAEEKESIVAINVESRDIQKNPYLFSIAYFKPNSIDLFYTYVPGMSPKKRRLDMLKYYLNLLTVVSPCYAFDISQIFQLMEHAAGEMGEYVTSDYERLFAAYDTIKTELASMQSKVTALSDSNSKLSKQNHEFKEKNDELQLKLRKLESMSDEVLMLKVQEWLSDHKGEVNVSQFSKVYGVPEMRVEQILNKMVMEGYIEERH
jgi:hypothetical protein